MLAQTGRRRLLLPVPFPVWNLLTAALAPLPNAPVSRDQVRMMQRDNVVGAQAASLHDLGITPTSVEAVVPGYLRR